MYGPTSRPKDWTWREAVVDASWTEFMLEQRAGAHALSGLVFLTLHQFDQADSCLRDSIPLALQSGSTHYALASMINLASVYCELGRLKERSRIRAGGDATGSTNGR